MGQYQQDLPPELKKLFEIINNFKRTFLKGGGGSGGQNKGSSAKGISIAFIVIIVIGFFSSFYTVEPDESGVVLRFGKYIETTPSGLNFKIPFGIDKVYIVQTTTIRKEEFGFRTTHSGVVSQYRKGSGFDNESLMLTGDLNVADVEWTIQFKVNDPYKFLFKVRNVKKNLRDASESTMRLVVGDRTVNDILTTGRVAIADEAKTKLQQVYNKYDMGISITNIILQDVNPPELVKNSFNEVNAAKQEQEKMINEAWEAYNKAIPVEKGKALQAITVAEGYATERINKAEGEANRFIAMHKAYQKAPDITRTRLYLEKMESIFSRMKQFYIMDPSAKTLLPHLNIKKKGAK
jgi:membrane protease subunit HflK